MTDRTFGGVELTRAPAAANPGPLDESLYDLVEARFRRVVEEEPTWATYLGIHAWDDRLPDPSRSGSSATPRRIAPTWRPSKRWTRQG